MEQDVCNRGKNQADQKGLLAIIHLVAKEGICFSPADSTSADYFVV
jgi:hypothetical protein